METGLYLLEPTNFPLDLQRQNLQLNVNPIRRGHGFQNSTAKSSDHAILVRDGTRCIQKQTTELDIAENIERERESISHFLFYGVCPCVIDCVNCM